jgi:hypothetical protein
MLRRGVRRWRICPRGNNVFNAAAGGTTGKQRHENQNCNDAHEDETPRLYAHPNAEKLGPVPASGPPAKHYSGGFPQHELLFSFAFQADIFGKSSKVLSYS